MDTSIVISVIIPALNEAKTLGRTIECVTANIPDEYPFEIIVGDHGSTDSTREVALAEGTAVIDCHFYRNVAAVRNKCATQASGLYFLFIDADISLTPEWAVALPEAIRIADQGSVVGSRPKSFGGSAIERSWFNFLTPSYIGSAHMLMRGTAFWGLQGFDVHQDTGEDVAFCRRAELNRVAVENLPALEVYHRRYPSTSSDFMERELWHGIGDWSGIIPKSTTAFVSATFVMTLAVGFFYSWVWLASFGILVAFTKYKFPVWFSWDTYLVRLWLSMLYMVSRFFSIFLQHKHKRTFQW